MIEQEQWIENNAWFEEHKDTIEKLFNENIFFAVYDKQLIGAGDDKFKLASYFMEHPEYSNKKILVRSFNNSVYELCSPRLVQRN